MGKKGELTSRTLVLWGVAAFVLVIVAFTFFGPQLWGGVTKAAFSFGIGALPDQEAPQLEGELEPPPQLEAEFYKLVGNIKKAVEDGADKCLVYITDLSGFEDYWRIELSAGKASLYRISGRGAPVNKLTEDLTNFNPCTIIGQSAVDFYIRYVTSDARRGVATPSSGTITLSGDNRYSYLYKTSNNFCTFKFYGGDCTDPRNNGDEGIPDGCKKEMPHFASAQENTFSTCNNVCRGDLTICGNDPRDLECIAAINDGSDSKLCYERFDFEVNPPDDYCMCGGAFGFIRPLNYAARPTCDQICDTAGGKTCMMGIDDGATIKACNDNNIGFEEFDDYCICGDASQKEFPDSLPETVDCVNLCGGDPELCIMGIDDGGKYIRECSLGFEFENDDRRGDDYCICGDASQKRFPGSLPETVDCDNICGNRQELCIMGIDDGTDENRFIRECYFDFLFENDDRRGDDYCICGDTSIKKIVPLNYYPRPSCNDICEGEGQTCILGVDDASTGKACNDNNIGFEESDDYCVCATGSQKISNPFWQGTAP